MKTTWEAKTGSLQPCFGADSNILTVIYFRLGNRVGVGEGY